MTVSELMEKLKELDQTLPVCQRVAEGDDHDYFDTLSVEVVEIVFDDADEDEKKYDEDGDRIPRKCCALEYM